MRLICPNCGFSNEDDSRFCSQCGFALSSITNSNKVAVSNRVSIPKVEVSQTQLKKSNEVIFVPPPRPTRVGRSQHSVLAITLFLLFIGSILTIMFLVPLVFVTPYHGSHMDDFGTMMGEFGMRMGDFGIWIGNVFGSLGEKLGEFFGSIGEFLGDIFSGFFAFDSSYHGLIVVFRVCLSVFLLVVIIVALVSVIRRPPRPSRPLH